MANPNPSPATRFKAGNKANPGGKPEGARNRLGNAFLKALVDDFEKHGAAAIEILRCDSPLKYCELVAGLLPTEANVNVTADATVTHRAEPVSETDRWLESLAGSGADGEAPQPLPN